MDIQAIVKRSRDFYRWHGLGDWGDSLPESGQPIDEPEFERAFAFPAFDVQTATLDRLIEATARQPAPAVPDNQQYREPFLADTWSKTPNGKILQGTDNLGPRPYGPYVLVFSATPCKNAWGRTGKQIAELFQAKGWQGLTVPEYLVVQRFYCEQFGDHRFFDEPLDDSLSHWLWLVDSMTDSEMSVAYGSSRGVNLQACKLGNRDSRRAAIAAAVVPL
jgi:hypothetical protein